MGCGFFTTDCTEFTEWGLGLRSRESLRTRLKIEAVLRHSAMGAFSVGCKVENHRDREKALTIAKLLVDSGSKFTWIPGKRLESIGVAREKKDVQFRMANGQTITRSVGFAIHRVGKEFTIDEVVFGEPGDLALLGARTLEGLNVMVDSARKRLIAAGPLPAV